MWIELGQPSQPLHRQPPQRAEQRRMRVAGKRLQMAPQLGFNLRVVRQHAARVAARSPQLARGAPLGATASDTLVGNLNGGLGRAFRPQAVLIPPGGAPRSVTYLMQ